MTSNRIFEIIFERYGKGRVHLKRTTSNFVRECVDFKATETEYALNTLSKGQRKPKIKYPWERKVTHLLLWRHTTIAGYKTKSACKTKSERVNKQ